LQLQTTDPLRIFNALTALRKVCKRYEYKVKEQRGPLHEVVRTAFPAMQTLMANVLTLQVHSHQHQPRYLTLYSSRPRPLYCSQSLEAAAVLRMGLKIFHSATMYALPDASTGVDPSAWFRIIGYDTCLCFLMSR